jgi:hypothetical protein
MGALLRLSPQGICTTHSIQDKFSLGKIMESVFLDSEEVICVYEVLLESSQTRSSKKRWVNLTQFWLPSPSE